MWTPATVTTEASNSRWVPGNGWVEKEALLMQRKKSRSIEQICSGRPKDGMAGRDAKRILAGLDGRYCNDPVD